MKLSQLFLIGLGLYLMAWMLTGCAGSKPTTGSPAAERMAPTAKLDSANVTVNDRVNVTVKPTPPPSPLPLGEGVAKPGILSGIGSLFSTPEGRANRQAVRLAKAAVPGKIKVGKGGQYAPNATQAANGGNKTTAPTTAAAPDATVSNAAENSQQQNVQGDGNELQAKQANPTQEAKDWKAELASPVGKVVAGTAGLIILATGIYALVLWRKKKQAQSLIS